MRSLAWALCGFLLAASAAAGCGSVTATPDGGSGGAGGGAAGAAGTGGGSGSAGTTGAGGTTGSAGTTGTGGGATAGTTGTGGRGGAGGGPATCAFAAKYTLIDGGGLVAMQDTETLSPPNLFHMERESFGTADAGRRSCDPPMPDCPDPARIDVSDVEAAIAHPDVQAVLAMATRPTYGNMLIADGPNFSFMRADGRGFNAGLQCDTPSTTCKPIPPGVVALVAVLKELIRQQRMHASCNLLN